MDFNSQIEWCLTKLFDNSSNYNISIDLIQKLAQELKLDTFIDKDAYTHVTTTQSSENFKRLSIASSLILIDIDFLDDNNILKVYFSLANQFVPVKGSAIKSSTAGPGGTTKVNIKQLNLFLNQDSESILLKNLSGKKLGYFPSNLKYLSSLDQLSSSHQDLFSYLDKIGSVLSSINEVEKAKFSESIGEVSFNNQSTGQLGLFLHFWRDYIEVNETRQDGSIIGQDYKILVTVTKDKEEENEVPSEDENVWRLNSGDYVFSFDEPLANLPLEFHLDPISVPLTVIQYLGIFPQEQPTVSPYESLNVGNIRVRKDVPFLVVIKKQDPALDKMVTFSRFALSNICQLADVVPVLRNFIVLNKLVLSLTRGIEVEAYSVENENDFTAKKALKDTLNIEDEGLFGLTLSAENPVLSSIKSIKPEIDINAFMDIEDPDAAPEIEAEAEITPPPAPVENNLVFIVEDLDFASKTIDIIAKVRGSYQGSEIDINFKISGGVVLSISSGEDDMVDDEKDFEKRFLEALRVTENVIQTVLYIYNNN